MISSNVKSAIGVFDHEDQALKAIEALKAAGFSDGEIAIASKRFSQKYEGLSGDAQNVAADGAVMGTAVGTGLGALVGVVGSLLIPGAVPILAGTVVLNTVLGGMAGAAGGAFAGPFIAMGWSEADSDRYSKQVEGGKSVIIVYAPDRLNEVEKIMTAHGAYDDSMATSP